MRQDLRALLLDRILSAAPLPQSFLDPSFAAMPRAFATRVLLRTDLATAQRNLPEAIGLFEQTAEGVLLHNQADRLDWFARALAGLPFYFEILSPDALRVELAAVVACLARICHGFVTK